MIRDLTRGQFDLGRVSTDLAELEIQRQCADYTYSVIDSVASFQSTAAFLL